MIGIAVHIGGDGIVLTFDTTRHGQCCAGVSAVTVLKISCIGTTVGQFNGCCGHFHSLDPLLIFPEEFPFFSRGTAFEIV